jgi:aminoglycoside phosphotransferase (APT) family kinase protein
VEVLPPAPPGWPAEGDTVGFAMRLPEVSQRVHAAHRAEFGRMFRELEIPGDPIDAARADLARLASRPFRLLHTDVHRKNMIVRAAAVVFIDWELALLGDPVYDLAVHLHKMAYLPDERERLLTLWEMAEPVAATGDWRGDLELYLRHERVKSAVVDSIRYAKLIRSGQCTPDSRAELVTKMVAKLRAARAVWGLPGEVDQERVDHALGRPVSSG